MSFWYLQFFQKMNKKNQPNYYGTSSRIIFFRFLEELKTPKRHFETNWPLTWLICFLKIGYVTTAYLHPWIDWMKCHSWIKIRYLSTYLLTYLVSMNFIRNFLQNAWLYFAGYFIYFLTSDSMIYARTNHQFSSRRTSEFDFPEITTFIRHL